MVSDPVNKSNEEEYQFVDSEQSAGFSPPSAKRPSMSSNVQDSGGRKKIFIIIGIFAALFCLYKLFGVFSAAPEKPQAEMPIPVEAVIKKPAPALSASSSPTTTLSPVAETPKPESVISQQVSTVANKVGTLERVVSQVSQSNANLQDQMAGVATAIAEIRNNVSSLSDQMTVLSKEKQPEIKKAGAKSAEKKAVSKATPEKTKKNVAAASGASYFVKAMIQGRAWLMTPQGAMLTVAEGDSLPGYGQVTDIDLIKGEVLTSSGVAVRYKADDK